MNLTPFMYNFELFTEITDNNLFFKSYIIKGKNDRMSNNEEVSERPSKLSTYIKEEELPFNDMVELILKFKDIRERIIASYLKAKNQKGARRSSDDNEGIRNNDKKSCSIL